MNLSDRLLPLSELLRENYQNDLHQVCEEKRKLEESVQQLEESNKTKDAAIANLQKDTTKLCNFALQLQEKSADLENSEVVTANEFKTKLLKLLVKVHKHLRDHEPTFLEEDMSIPC